MESRITVDSVDEIPRDSRVCHYDELAEAAKEELPHLMEADDIAVEEAVADAFRECDLVKYTDYYEIVVGDAPS